MTAVLELEELTRQTKRALEQAHLIAPNAAPPSLASIGASASRANLWVNTEQLQLVLNTNLKAAQYRQIVSRLSLLARYASLVTHLESRPELHHVLGGDNVIQRFHTTLERFMNENAKTNNLLAEKDADRALWTASERKVDRQGRAYSRGRRKESSAQAWLIRAKPDTLGVPDAVLMRPQVVIIFDAVRDEITVVTPVRPSADLGAEQAYGRAVERITRVLDTLQRWLAQGTLRRFGVVVRHHELGFDRNAMTVFDVPDDEVDARGAALAAQPGVTLCYRRARAEGWPYNLYCMVHGREREAVRATVEAAARAAGLSALPRETLFSLRRFKQQGGQYFGEARAAEIEREHA